MPKISYSMAKIERENVPFTQVANAVLNDNSISFEVKGIFAYLFSKPENWNFSAERIAFDSKESKGVIQRILRELEEAGYLTRIKHSDGRMTYSLKFAIEPKLGNTIQAPLPKAGNSLPGKTVSINNKENNINNINNIFDWEKSKTAMMEKEGSDMDIIATFMHEKKLVPRNREELAGYISRYRKTAIKIAPFVKGNQNKLFKAIDICKEESVRIGYKWELETIYKKITKI